MTTSYKYNQNGLRTEKTVNDMTHEYTYLGSRVTREIIRDEQGQAVWTIYYSYAGGNSPVSMNVNGTEYYFLKNGQGDVTHVVDGDGNVVAGYDYDAWGNHLSIVGDEVIAELNPYRYRGYRYDSETGLYYLQTRYYNPEWGRFINPDILLGPGNLANMYVYVNGNPVNMVDHGGMFSASIAFDEGLNGDLSGGGGGIIVIIVVAVTRGVDAVAESVRSFAEKAKNILNTPDQSVYVLEDGDSKVKYVGRTKDVEQRRAAHKGHPIKGQYEMKVIATGLTLLMARGLEQVVISAYTLDNLDNGRREIAKGNLSGFSRSMEAIGSILGGIPENELFNLMGR